MNGVVYAAGAAGKVVLLDATNLAVATSISVLSSDGSVMSGGTSAPGSRGRTSSRPGSGTVRFPCALGST